MTYLVVTESRNLIEHIYMKYHTCGEIKGGVLFETSSGHSETEEIFRKILKDHEKETFAIFRITNVHPFGRQRTIMDACSTEWVKQGEPV